MAKRQFERPAPGKYYTEAQRKAWGAEQDRLRAERAARAAQGIAEPKAAPKPRASRAKTLVADCSGSTCFDSLTYRSGVVTASFIGPAAGVWEYDMTLAEARKWLSADSLGGYFNDAIREPPAKGN